MIEIHVYGKLRRYAKNGRCGRDCVVTLAPRQDETIASLLGQVGIPVEEINHIFFNSELLVTRTSAAPYMGFQQARSDLFDWDLSIPVAAGDRVGLFGRDMPVLGM